MAEAEVTLSPNAAVEKNGLICVRQMQPDDECFHSANKMPAHPP